MQQRQRDTHHRRQNAHQPEALHNLSLAPATQLKMVVNRRATKQALTTRPTKVHDLQHVADGFQFVIVQAGEHKFVVFFVELDVGFGILQIEALMDFLQRLLDGVAHFRQVDFGHDIKCIFGHVLMTQCYQDSLGNFLDHGG